MKVVCCECKKVLKDGAEPASHTYCIPCSVMVLAEFNRYFERLEKEKAGGVGTGQVAITPLAKERMTA